MSMYSSASMSILGLTFALSRYPSTSSSGTSSSGTSSSSSARAGSRRGVGWFGGTPERLCGGVAEHCQRRDGRRFVTAGVRGCGASAREDVNAGSMLRLGMLVEILVESDSQ